MQFSIKIKSYVMRAKILNLHLIVKHQKNEIIEFYIVDNKEEGIAFLQSKNFSSYIFIELLVIITSLLLVI